jgi:hypothetical protein
VPGAGPLLVAGPALAAQRLAAQRLVVGPALVGPVLALLVAGPLPVVEAVQALSWRVPLLPPEAAGVGEEAADRVRRSRRC